MGKGACKEKKEASYSREGGWRGHGRERNWTVREYGFQTRRGKFLTRAHQAREGEEIEKNPGKSKGMGAADQEKRV